MAASNTVTDVRPYANGLLIERGTFDLDDTTTLTITAATGDSSYTAGNTGIIDIYNSTVYSDSDSTDLVQAKDVAPNKLKITSASGDTGDYVLIGPAA